MSWLHLASAWIAGRQLGISGRWEEYRIEPMSELGRGGGVRYGPRGEIYVEHPIQDPTDERQPPASAWRSPQRWELSPHTFSRQ